MRNSHKMNPEMWNCISRSGGDEKSLGTVRFWGYVVRIWFGCRVEVEGFEPSSNHGPNKLSTCLVIELVFENWQARDDQSVPYPLKFNFQSRLLKVYFRFTLHHLVQTSRNRAMGWCLVHVTVTRIKPTYYTSV